MEFFGRCTAHLVHFQLHLCFLPADNIQQMENANWCGVLLKRQSYLTFLLNKIIDCFIVCFSSSTHIQNIVVIRVEGGVQPELVNPYDKRHL